MIYKAKATGGERIIRTKASRRLTTEKKSSKGDYWGKILIAKENRESPAMGFYLNPRTLQAGTLKKEERGGINSGP